MSAASTAKATPSFAAVDELGWNRLNDLAFESKNRQLLAHIVHAKNACFVDATRRHIRDNRTVAVIVDRAIQNDWTEVLESAATSQYMTDREYAAILRCGKTFTEEVYLGILNSHGAESPAILSMLGRVDYDSVKKASVAKRIKIVKDTLDAAKEHPEAYPLEDDGTEDDAIFQAVDIALALGRNDLVDELITTGCTGSTTADRLALMFNAQLQHL
ncbi:hypothetical protein [Arthrobacter sp. 162MFSha1.1]|uniref:hypothetical protein n=1 Tax=Arthrobacter sp. 162MFSha1.1 TaxID=1151119 RepID=UPI000363FD36|nr:hypothetical protein [Arthrobacter sp. 162MFSha1.1]